jgi:hypothetical protein
MDNTYVLYTPFGKGRIRTCDDAMISRFTVCRLEPLSHFPIPNMCDT